MTKLDNNSALKIIEEAWKNEIRDEFFSEYKCSCLNKIDFVVSEKTQQKNLFYDNDVKYYLWAEAKRSNKEPLNALFTQLLLTIGQDKYYRNGNIMLPQYLGAFDNKRMAFIETSVFITLLNSDEIDWTVTPSNYSTDTFKKLKNKIDEIVQKNNRIKFEFDLKEDHDELKEFIKRNFKTGKKQTSLIEITKSNYHTVYLRWLQEVKPCIHLDWEQAKKAGIQDVDFYLADLLSENDITVINNLYVLLKKEHYEYSRLNTPLGTSSLSVLFDIDKHTAFWLKYKRPPKKDYQKYILERRDFLLPQNIREERGAFFTPSCWVDLSQKYMKEYFGNNWQAEYYIWDCCAGTGNMENGLINKYNIWASTLDQADVDIMRERKDISLLKNHIFQFDFLNGNFNDLPDSLKQILDNPVKRKKLVIYINPPYAEATNARTISKSDDSHRTNISDTKVKKIHGKELGSGSRDLAVQFLYRIYKEIPEAYICCFSTTKALQGQNCRKFRSHFLAQLESLFLVPASTFDNVTGDFAVGFFIWNTQKKVTFEEIEADIYNKNSNFISKKNIKATPPKNIKNWLRDFSKNCNNNHHIGYLVRGSSDVQNNRIVHITLSPSQSVLNASNASSITQDNLIVSSIFLAVRKIISDNWLNDREQYLYPNDLWINDQEFQYDCLMYALFNNNIKSAEGTNHWIPFTENEINATNNFSSNFMSRFINGEILSPNEFVPQSPIIFSKEAKEVFSIGKQLYQYYHSKENSNPDASLYDIQVYFKGKNQKNILNRVSLDNIFNQYNENLSLKIQILSKKIEEKIFKYGFLFS